VVVPATETASAAPFAFKSYAFEAPAVRSLTRSGTAAAIASKSKVLTTAIGEFPVAVGGRDYAMLPATVRAAEPRLFYPPTDKTGGYRCDTAESPATVRLTLDDPLNPARRITTGQVTHVCSAWDPTERTEAEPEQLLCFAAAGDRDSRYRVSVRDMLGPQIAELGPAAAICVEAAEK
jgi:hypothetical protein